MSRLEEWWSSVIRDRQRSEPRSDSSTGVVKQLRRARQLCLIEEALVCLHPSVAKPAPRVAFRALHAPLEASKDIKTVTIPPHLWGHRSRGGIFPDPPCS